MLHYWLEIQALLRDITLVFKVFLRANITFVQIFRNSSKLYNRRSHMLLLVIVVVGSGLVTPQAIGMFVTPVFAYESSPLRFGARPRLC
jgi:hypothetical protein